MDVKPIRCFAIRSDRLQKGISLVSVRIYQDSLRKIGALRRKDLTGAGHLLGDVENDAGLIFLGCCAVHFSGWLARVVKDGEE